MLYSLLGTDKPSTPLVLLPWAVETAVTTWVCILENEASDAISAEQKTGLRQMYLPYFGLGQSIRVPSLRAMVILL